MIRILFDLFAAMISSDDGFLSPPYRLLLVYWKLSVGAVRWQVCSAPVGHLRVAYQNASRLINIRLQKYIYVACIRIGTCSAIRTSINCSPEDMVRGCRFFSCACCSGYVGADSVVHDDVWFMNFVTLACLFTTPLHWHAFLLWHEDRAALRTACQPVLSGLTSRRTRWDDIGGADSVWGHPRRDCGITAVRLQWADVSNTECIHCSFEIGLKLVYHGLQANR